MKLPDTDTAKIVRDKCIQAFDVINDVYVEVEGRLAEEDRRDFRLAVGHTMAAILENLLEPTLKQYPEWEVDTAQWREIAQQRKQ
jgi:DNA-binding transcriptional LysR family regulator